MVAYLAFIYKDLYKVQNARLDYLSLIIRLLEAYTKF
jgi:hypothetical protein